MNVDALLKLAKKYDWSIPQLATKLNVDYSYLHRILKGEKKGGKKLFKGIYNLCKSEGLNIEDYIFFDNSLFEDNGKK